MLKVADRVYNGSYVARITGSDPKFGLKREFLDTDRKFSKEKGEFTMSIKDSVELAENNIIALKLIKKGQTKKDAKENFYKVAKVWYSPEEEKTLGREPELHDMVSKISLDEVKKIFPAAEKSVEKKTPDRVSEGLDR